MFRAVTRQLRCPRQATRLFSPRQSLRSGSLAVLTTAGVFSFVGGQYFSVVAPGTQPQKHTHLPLDKLQKPSNGKPLTVLVACGSFSPLTYMHLRMFESARDYLMVEAPADKQLDIVGAFLSPVHDKYGKKSLVSAHHREEMCRLAIVDSSWINLSTWELAQPDWTRTAKVLDEYSRIINESKLYDGHVSVNLLCGADLLESFEKPGVWREADMHQILKNGLVVMTRKGVDLTKLIDESKLLSPYKDNIHIVPSRIKNNISSTIVRESIGKGMSLKYLLPDSVANYIYQHKLYGHNPSHNRFVQPRSIL